ncbi:MAG: diguanylate cyclase domain-containing protein [Gammaproteobacteria bacterium]
MTSRQPHWSREILVIRLKKSVLEKIIDTTSDGIIVADASSEDLPIVYVNPAFEKMCGYPRNELLRKTFKFLQGEDRDQDSVQELRVAVRAGRECDVLVRSHRKDGGLFWNQLRVAPIVENQKIVWWIAIARDVGAIRDMQAQRDTQKEALRDAKTQLPKDRLTGLYSRAYFDDVLAREWAASGLVSRRLTLFIFDVDYFEIYNETFGRGAGDSCLRLVAQAIRSCFRRDSDLVVRYDGQRFACLAASMGSGDAIEFAQMICDRVKELCIHNPKSPVGKYITVSGGVAALKPGQDQTVALLIDTALEALDVSQMNGGGRASGTGETAD